MSEPYELYVLFKRGIPPADATRNTHEALAAVGAHLDEDSLVYLNTWDSVEPPPETVRNPEDGLRRLAEWPTLGSVDYVVPEGTVYVYFGVGQVPSLANSIILSVPQRVLEQTEAVLTNRLVTVGRMLHKKLNADRTLMGWGLSSKGFVWEDEITRLSRGEIAGSYDMLDLVRTET
jgi:hypothetical protein